MTSGSTRGSNDSLTLDEARVASLKRPLGRAVFAPPWSSRAPASPVSRGGHLNPSSLPPQPREPFGSVRGQRLHEGQWGSPGRALLPGRQQQ